MLLIVMTAPLFINDLDKLKTELLTLKMFVTHQFYLFKAYGW